MTKHLNLRTLHTLYTPGPPGPYSKAGIRCEIVYPLVVPSRVIRDGVKGRDKSLNPLTDRDAVGRISCRVVRHVHLFSLA